jgi:hypothetical protein
MLTGVPASGALANLQDNDASDTMTPPIDPTLVPLRGRGCPRGEPKTMAVRGRRDASGKRGAPQRFGVENNSRERKAASGPNRRVAVQRERRERLIITTNLQARRPTAMRQGLKLKGSESLESFGKNDASKPVQRSMRRR